ncbi:hypothetical protein L226DRAFT_424841, partial [Lentinus tigrinus ALCF2SS1-7]|uniref:uncharacterized protein n=1 Tax=Lentinus tigrinus ALCF2SS1-7 TaxID=1328758 RepID=UPI001165EBBB
AVKTGYEADPLFSKILEAPQDHKRFTLRDGFIYTTNRCGEEVLCLPRAKFKNKTTTQIVLDQAHETIGHYGAQCTAEYIRRWFWW